MQKKVLGRGLSALMPDTPAESTHKVLKVKISEIAYHRHQPRQDASAQKMQELVASIKAKGVIQPVLLRRKDAGFELIAGERRLRAATQLGFTEVPAIIKDVNDSEALQLALIENLQRENLNPIEEALAYQQLISEFGFTQERVAQSVGKDASTVSNSLRLLKLPKEIQQAVRKGSITMGHARTILGLGSLDEQSRIFQRALTQQLSVRQLEGLIQKKRGGLRRKRLTLRDPNLASLEEQLRIALGTKVHISAGRKRGKIIVEYYSLEELERITKLLKRIS